MSTRRPCPLAPSSLRNPLPLSPPSSPLPFPAPLYASFHPSVPSVRPYREYKLHFRQQPRQARMCGIGEKGTASARSPLCGLVKLIASLLDPVDRRPIDPPPIIQLDVIDHAEVSPKAPESASARRKGKGRETAQPASIKSFLQSEFDSPSLRFFQPS
jgi:hypothetical protein